MESKEKLYSEESGMVAIVVTVFFMIILSLIVLSFSQSSRREQRQALDDGLSSDAYRAADSGINEWATYIKAYYNTPGFPLEKTRCDSAGFGAFNSPVAYPDEKVSSDGNTAHPCVLFDRAPRTLQIDKLSTEEGKLIPLDTDGGPPNRTVTFEWKKSDAAGTFTGCVGMANVLNFTNQNTYLPNCEAGMLRVMLMYVKPGSANRDGLSENIFTVFFRPTTDAGTSESQVVFEPRGNTAVGGALSQSQVIPADCTTVAHKCRGAINVSSLPAAGSLYADLRSMYTPNDVTISGTKAGGGPGGQPVRFTRAQIMIDSTGRASDVLHRLQVRVPLYASYKNTGGFVLDSTTGICKRLSVLPDSATSQDSECQDSYFN